MKLHLLEIAHLTWHAMTYFRFFYLCIVDVQKVDEDTAAEEAALGGKAKVVFKVQLLHMFATHNTPIVMLTFLFH